MTRAIAAMEAAMNMDQVIRITDAELNDALAEVNTARIVAQRATERARAKLARVSTEALMAGMTLRQVANKTGYSISSVRRAKLLKPPSYPATTRDGFEQHWDGERWLLEFRPTRRHPDDAAPQPTAEGLTSEATRRAAAGLPPPDYSQQRPHQQQLPDTSKSHGP